MDATNPREHAPLPDPQEIAKGVVGALFDFYEKQLEDIQKREEQDDYEGVSPDWRSTGTWEVELAWKKYAAKVQFAPFYDPKGERIKA